MRVFMDASAWVAGAVNSDSQAENLHRVMATLRGQRIELFTTTWTLYEALAVVRRRKPEAVQLLFERAVNNGSVIAVDPDVEREALARFLKWRDKKASVVDHANTLVAGLHRCEAIISFDRDFVPLAAAGGMRLLS
jgi:predicted nucleic acid-binding protein